MFLLAAFDESHEPSALGLTWGGLFSSADVGASTIGPSTILDPAVGGPAGPPGHPCSQVLRQCARPGGVSPFSDLQEVMGCCLGHRQKEDYIWSAAGIAHLLMLSLTPGRWP